MDFFQFQEALYYIVELDKRNMYVVPFQILHFHAYPQTLPVLRRSPNDSESVSIKRRCDAKMCRNLRTFPGKPDSG